MICILLQIQAMNMPGTKPFTHSKLSGNIIYNVEQNKCIGDPISLTAQHTAVRCLFI